jgi:hypothetical protein
LQYFSIFHFFVVFLLNGLTSNMLFHSSHSGVVFKSASDNSQRGIECLAIFKFSTSLPPILHAPGTTLRELHLP